MGMNAREDRLAALAVLAEPLRRRFYLYVASSTAPISREGAAEALVREVAHVREPREG